MCYTPPFQARMLSDYRRGRIRGSVDGDMNTREPRPTSIRIFLADGVPEGLRIVEESSWTGRGVVASRAQIGRALAREEMAQPGAAQLPLAHYCRDVCGSGTPARTRAGSIAGGRGDAPGTRGSGRSGVIDQRLEVAPPA